MHCGMLIDTKRCYGCNACTIICKQRHGTTPKTMWCRVYEKEVGTYPNAYRTFLPALCMHCGNAACVRACPTGASHYAEDGTVQIDSEKCIGCRMCMGACPYNARFFNLGSAEDNAYFPGQETPDFWRLHDEDHIVGVVEKCKLCPDRRAENLEPACVQACPTHARIFGDLDDAESEINREITRLDTKPLLEEYGTRPCVYYAGVN